MNHAAVLRVAEELESQTRFEDRISSAWMREKAAELRAAVADERKSVTKDADFPDHDPHSNIEPNKDFDDFLDGVLTP